MTNYVLINNEFIKRNEAKMSIFDRGFLYGDGIFEGIRIYSGNIFKGIEHINRLFDSAKSLNFSIGITKEEIEQQLIKAVAKNNMHDGYIRVIVTRGDGDLGLNPTNVHSKANVIIVVQQLTMFSSDQYTKGIKAVTVATKRNLPDALNPKIKSLNYLSNILAKMDSNTSGFDEAIMLNAQGYVTEGSTDNIFIVKDGIITTPPTYIGALDGITRRQIMRLAVEQGHTVNEQPFTSYDMHTADEVFLTGTAVEVVPVIEIDGRVIADGVPGSVYKQLNEEFKKYVTVEGIKVFKE